MAKSNLTAARVRELLHYDEGTGAFTHLVRRNGVKAVGTRAGCVSSHGYLKIGIDRKQFMAHRLAWLYMTGEWPKAEIDHRDGNQLNNAFANLRDVDSVTNKQNRHAPASGKSGLLGAYWNKNHRAWISAIKPRGQPRRFLGDFPTAELAHAAYMDAKRLLHESNLS